MLAAAAAAAIVACVRWNRALPSASSAAPLMSKLAIVEMIPDSALSEAEQLVVANDPFRLSNSAPIPRYDPADDANFGSLGVLPPAPRPTLVLKAIVGGPPWQAVIEGIPGQTSAAVVRSGEKFGTLTIRAVSRDSVAVQTTDTAWVLTFKGRS